jgi:AraC-like DNA-binding protein
MPTSTVRTFTDPDDFMSATIMRTASAELTITGRGAFAAKTVRIDLPRLWVACHTDTLARTSHTVRRPGRANIVFRAGPGPGVLMSGVAMEPTNLIRTSEDHDGYQVTAGPSSLNTMSLSVEDIASFSMMAECDLTPPRDTLGVIPLPDAMARLQRLHTATVHLAETTPEIIVNPNAARGLEQMLIEAMVSCLANGDTLPARNAYRHHTKIIRRLEEVLRANPETSPYMDDLCKAIGTSYRTLNTCCQEHLGMGPKRYLTLRRMHLAHQALSRGDPVQTSVTAIATDYGFWELGRFSVAYRSLFGESPSITLRRLPDRSDLTELAGANRQFAESA